MANNAQPPPGHLPPQDRKIAEIGALLGQVLRHMPVADRIKKLRNRRKVMPSAETLADVTLRERARRIAARSPKPHQEPEPPEITVQPSKKRGQAAAKKKRKSKPKG